MSDQVKTNTSLLRTVQAEVSDLKTAKGTQITILIDGHHRTPEPGEPPIDVISRAGVEIAHVCYHPQLGPIQTCDTCMVEVDGQLMRACATAAAVGMNVSTVSARAHAAQVEAFD